MGRLSTGCGERSRSRSVVHAKLLGRDQQHEVQPRRTELEDLKPDTFESNVMLGLAAQMQECDEDKFVFAAQQDYCLGAEKITEFDKHIYLAMKSPIAGIAREIVDTSKTAGEAWYRVTDWFFGKNVQGATATASQLQELKRLSQIAESFHSLNVTRKLVKEFARQSPKEPTPSAIVKVAYMKVVLETYRRALETQVDVNKVEPHDLKDKVLAFIRNNTSGTAPMDIGGSHRHQVLAVPTRVPRRVPMVCRTVTQT